MYKPTISIISAKHVMVVKYRPQHSRCTTSVRYTLSFNQICSSTFRYTNSGEIVSIQTDKVIPV